MKTIVPFLSWRLLVPLIAVLSACGSDNSSTDSSKFMQWVGGFYSDISLGVGEKKSFSSASCRGFGSPIYSTDDPSALTIDAAYETVTANKQGTFKLYAYCLEDSWYMAAQASITVTVTEARPSLRFSQSGEVTISPSSADTSQDNPATSSFPVSKGGGTISYSCVGACPTGISVDASTGRVTVKANTRANTTATIKAVQEATELNFEASQTYSLKVDFPPSSTYAQKCSSSNIYYKYGFYDLNTEKNWLRSYMNEVYLWYREMPLIDGALPRYNLTSTDSRYPHFYSLDNYLMDLRTPSLTPSNKRRDHYSFMVTTYYWDEYQKGVVYGYGFDTTNTNTSASRYPLSLRVKFVEPDSPAAKAGLQRGDTLTAVGTTQAAMKQISSFTIDDVDTLEVILYPSKMTPYFFSYQRAGVTNTVQITPGKVSENPVPDFKVLDVTMNGSVVKVGYLLFNSHITSAENKIADAISAFKSAGVQELVLDLRYNGGGLLYIASMLGYMIGGSNTANKKFAQTLVNDRQAAEDPYAFFNERCDYDLASKTCKVKGYLPTLNFSRVSVLTTSSTASASEAVINGLKGADIKVYQFGSTTYGKPYGFRQKDNCGLSYFVVDFETVNHKGEGGYADGIAPTCSAADDLDHALGERSEGSLASALDYVGKLRAGNTNPSCLATVAFSRVGGTAEPVTFNLNPLKHNMYRGFPTKSGVTLDR